MPTQATEIAALEAKRNEAQVRAEGALLGERRAAIARLVMLAMFAIVSSARRGPHNWLQTGVGAVFSIYAIITAVVLWRLAVADPRRSRWAPVALTVVDFTGVTALAATDIWFTGQLQLGQHAIAAAILMTFSVARMSVWHVVLSVACALVSLVIDASYGGQLASHAVVFIAAGYVVLGVVLALTNRALGAMFEGLRRRDNLTRFLPQQVAERVIARGPSALAPVEREVTVLFSDIRGFTTMSEGMGPSDVLTMLDDYFGRMSAVVKGHDGVVGKFLGDGLLAFWGVPDRKDDHAALAVKAARDMLRVVDELNAHRAGSAQAPIKIGIGIHTGNVAAGMLGGALQSEYTIIGDAVNVASRIEGLTKDHKVDVLISETTVARLGELPVRKVAQGEIRGRKEPVMLYTLG